MTAYLLPALAVLVIALVIAAVPLVGELARHINRRRRR